MNLLEESVNRGKVVEGCWKLCNLGFEIIKLVGRKCWVEVGKIYLYDKKVIN